MLTPKSAAGMSTARPAIAASSSPPTSAAGAVHHGQSFAEDACSGRSCEVADASVLCGDSITSLSLG